jgi:hypothetical protein
MEKEKLKSTPIVVDGRWNSPPEEVNKFINTKREEYKYRMAESIREQNNLK